MPPPLVNSATSVATSQFLPRFLAKKKYANGTTVTCHIFLGQNKFLTSPFDFLCAEFYTTWELDRHLPCDGSAAHSPEWQVLELLFGGLLTTHVCFSETSGSVNACVSETGGSDIAHMSETHISSTFPCTKRRKKSSADCCRRSKVFPIRIRSPFPS